MADNVGPPRFNGRCMGWVFLEIAVALGIAVAIVWWTFPRKPRSEEAARDREDGKR